MVEERLMLRKLYKIVISTGYPIENSMRHESCNFYY